MTPDRLEHGSTPKSPRISRFLRHKWCQRIVALLSLGSVGDDPSLNGDRIADSAIVSSMLEAGSNNLVQGAPLNPIYLTLAGANTRIDHDPYALFEFDDPRQIDLGKYSINPICHRVITQFQAKFAKQFAEIYKTPDIFPRESDVVRDEGVSLSEHIPSGLLDGIHPGNGPEIQAEYRKIEEERIQVELQLKNDQELAELTRKKELCSPSLRLYLNIMEGLGTPYRIIDEANHRDDEGWSHRHYGNPHEIVVATGRSCITNMGGTVITDGDYVYANGNGRFIDYRSQKTGENYIGLGNQVLPLDFESLMKEILFGLSIITGEENFSERSEEVFQCLAKRYLSLLPGGIKIDIEDDLYRKFTENLIVLCAHNEFYPSSFDFTRNGGLQMLLISALRGTGLTPEQMRGLSLGVQFA